MTPDLFLHEEILLLALRDERGTVETGAWYQQAVSGAVICELLLAERIAITPEGKKSLVDVVDATPMGDDLIDEWLATMNSSIKERKLEHWLSKISGTKHLKKRVAQRLVEREILEEAEDQILLFFHRTRYPEADAGPEREVRDRLHEAIFTDSHQVEARTIAVLSIAKAAAILPRIFDKKELKARGQRIDDLIAGELTGPVLAKTIEGIQAAIFVACIMPAAIS